MSPPTACRITGWLKRSRNGHICESFLFITYIPWRFILNWYSWTSLIFCCLRYPPPPPPPPSSIPKWLLTDWPWRRWSYTRRRRAGIALYCTSATTSRAARRNAGGCISRSSEKDCSQLTDLDRDDTDNRHCLYALYLSQTSRWNSVFKCNWWVKTVWNYHHGKFYTVFTDHLLCRILWL